MLIECPYCKAKVDAKEIKSHQSYDPKIDAVPFRATLLECASCKNPLLAGQSMINNEPDEEELWDSPTRLWPSPKYNFSWTIPQVVRISLEEADRCFKAGAFIACAVMCGRALEGICRHYKTKSQYLGGGLKELLGSGIIDKRLFEWSQELQKHRNIGAHASDDKITKEDAEDLLDFATAICEYVFVLNERFEDFMKRKENEKMKKEKMKKKR